MATYKIARGDTLSQIAKRHKTTTQVLQQLNPSITNIHAIRAGQTLNLPAPTPRYTPDPRLTPRPAPAARFTPAPTAGFTPAPVARPAPVPAPAPRPTPAPTPAPVSAPTQNLTPGMTGAGVKQLQDFLVSRGLMTPEQVATGPGIYGPRTRAAVAQLQQQLGVDTGGRSGYWGPKTLAALASAPAAGAPTPPAVGTTVDPTVGTTAPPAAIDNTQAILDALNRTVGTTAGTDYRQQMIDLIKNLGTQQESYLATLRGMPTAAQQFQTYREKLGLPAAEAGLTSTNIQIQKTQGLIDQLERDINSRISGFGGQPITSAQRRRGLAVEQRPLAEQLAILLRTAGIQQAGVQSAREQLSQMLSLAGRDRATQEAIARAPLEMTKGLLPTISSLAQHQSPAERLQQLIAQEQLKKSLGLGAYARVEGTPDITEYNFAKSQGFKGTFADWKRHMANLRVRATTPTPADKEAAYHQIRQRAAQLFADGMTANEYRQIQSELRKYGLGSYLSDFNKWISDMEYLTPETQKELGIPGKIEPTIQDILDNTKKLFQQYKDANYSREDIENLYKARHELEKIPSQIKRILDEIYPPQKGWWAQQRKKIIDLWKEL